MNFIKSLITRILNLFTSDAGKKALQTAADFTAAALPYIDIAAQVAAGLTPTTVDDAVLALVRQKYPQLFDGSITNGDQLKLFLLGVATDLMKARYPQLTTSIARTAVQLAYTGNKAS